MAEKNQANEPAKAASVQPAPAPAAAESLVKMWKDGQTIDVHPSCVKSMYVDNWYVLSTEIPRNAIYAQCAFAIEAQNLDLLPTVEGNAPGPITQETVGPITTVYANPGHVRRTPAVTKAETLLKTLLKRNGLFAVRA
jgi:hypothetical protein